MINDGFKYSFKVTGLERKQVANTIAQVLGTEVSYAGTPSFNYQVGRWLIDRDNLITSDEILSNKRFFAKYIQCFKNGRYNSNG